MTYNILVDKTRTGSGDSCPGSWGTIPNLSGASITVQSAASVLLLIAHVQVNPQGDNTSEFRFSVNGSPTNSPVITAFSDSATNEEAASMSLVWAVTGLTGSSNTFDVEWQLIAASPILDAGRDATFQVIEFADNAEIIVDSGTAGQVGDPASWGNLFNATGIDVNGTGSVILMLANVAYNMEGDESTDFAFSVDTTIEGATTSVFTDAANEGNGWSGMHVTDGLSSGTHTFELQWQARTGAGQTDSARRRTFQVIEFASNAFLRISKSGSASATAPGTMADIAPLSGSYTSASSGAGHFVIGNMVQAGDAQDSTADYRLNIDGTYAGAELIGNTDNADLVQRVLLTRFVNNLTGTVDFGLGWLEIGGATVADTARTRAFYAIEFLSVPAVTYSLSGTTKDSEGTALGLCKVFLVKDNGDNTYSWLDYVQSTSGTGAYEFTGIAESGSIYQVVAWRDLSPNVFDITDHVLQPVEE